MSFMVSGKWIGLWVLLGFAVSSSAAQVRIAGPHYPVRRQPIPSWKFLGPQPISSQGIFTPQIEIAPDGKPVLSYQDFSAQSHRATVKKWNGSQWLGLGTPGGASFGDAWYNNLAFSGNRTFITHRDYGINGKIGVFEFLNGTWNQLGGPSPSLHEAHYTSITVDSLGQPIVAFEDRSTSPIDKNTVMRFANGAWQVLGGVGSSPGTTGYNSVTVAPDGTIYTAFTDSTFGGRPLVQRYDEPTDQWVNFGTIASSYPGLSNVKLSLDRHGVPHLVGYYWQSYILVFRWNGTQFVALGGNVTGSDLPTVQSEGWRQWLSLRFDSFNRPLVAYQSLTNNRKASVVRWDPLSSQWSAVGDRWFTPGAADYLVFALGPNDTPYVAFRDGATQKLNVMVYE